MTDDTGQRAPVGAIADACEERWHHFAHVLRAMRACLTDHGDGGGTHCRVVHRLREIGLKDSDFRFFFRCEVFTLAISELLDAVTPLFNLPLNDRTDIAVVHRGMFATAPFDLRVFECGPQEA